MNFSLIPGLLSAATQQLADHTNAKVTTQEKRSQVRKLYQDSGASSRRMDLVRETQELPKTLGPSGLQLLAYEAEREKLICKRVSCHSGFSLTFPHKPHDRRWPQHTRLGLCQLPCPSANASPSPTFDKVY